MTDLIPVCVYDYCSAAQELWENKSVLTLIAEKAAIISKAVKQFSIVKPQVIEFRKVGPWGLRRDVWGML